MRNIGSHAGRRPKALGSRRSGRAGEPAVGDSMGASESLDDVPQDPRLPSYPPHGPTDRPRDLYGSLSARFGCLIPVSRSSTPELFVAAGNTVVSEVVTGGFAGALHDSALWLWPPKVLGAIAEGRPPCNQPRGIAAATVPAGTGFSAYARNRCPLFLVSFTLLCRPSFPASGTARRWSACSAG